jgi:threonine synthase
VQYVTTRNREKTYTWLHALNDDRGEDGGFYIPAEMPVFSQDQIWALAKKNPNQALADILNLLFHCELTRWDVDFSVGRYPVRLSAIVRRIAIAEGWHNVDWEFRRTVRDLSNLVRGTRGTSQPYGSWFEIAVRIGVLFGVFGELMRDEIVQPGKTVDVAVASGDLRAYMAARYAREWGLPIGDIILTCNENNNLWNLIRQGELRFGIPVKETETPDCDSAAPAELERLLYSCSGSQEVTRFMVAQEQGRAYFPDPVTLTELQKNTYVSVVGQHRMETTIPTIHKNHGYVFGPYSALCYAGLTDYRSATGSSNYGLIISDRGALRDDRLVAREMGIAVATLHNML